MKYSILLLTLLLMQSASAQDGWIDRTPPEALPGLYGVYALNDQNIWAVGEAGTIIHSTDGGATWSIIPFGTSLNFNNVEFINPDTGWVTVGSSSDSSIFRTTDGGLNWELQPLWTVAPNEYLTLDIDFVADTAGTAKWGFVTGGLGYVWRTTDYGEKWEVLRGSCGNGNFWSCCFTDKNTGLLPVAKEGDVR